MQHLRRDGGTQLSGQSENGRCPAGLVSEQREEGGRHTVTALHLRT